MACRDLKLAVKRTLADRISESLGTDFVTFATLPLRRPRFHTSESPILVNELPSGA